MRIEKRLQKLESDPILEIKKAVKEAFRMAPAIPVDNGLVDVEPGLRYAAGLLGLDPEAVVEEARNIVARQTN